MRKLMPLILSILFSGGVVLVSNSALADGAGDVGKAAATVEQTVTSTDMKGTADTKDMKTDMTKCADKDMSAADCAKSAATDKADTTGTGAATDNSAGTGSADQSTMDSTSSDMDTSTTSGK